jgi:Ca2+-binding EF-hand superfamily protein
MIEVDYGAGGIIIP